MDHNAQGRRPHFHRGRRGPDRRSGERRTAAAPEQQARGGSEHVDVEQIMREIRGRIAQRHGIELTTQQVQELAARRLEAILDPRHLAPGILQQLRQGAAAPPELPTTAPADGGYSFEGTTLYDTHRGVLRFIRRLLNPILKLFFNPTPLIHALHVQSRLNREAAAREAERDRIQAEWNALHYEILQRLVTEVSRNAIEMRTLTLRLESLGARVDFADRRLRAIEGAPAGGRAPARAVDAPPPAAASGAGAATESVTGESSAEAGQSEGTRRRRRRRRGRRGTGGPGDAVSAAAPSASDAADTSSGDAGDVDEGDENGVEEPAAGSAETVQPAAAAAEQVATEHVAAEQAASREEPAVSSEPAASTEPLAASEPPAAPEPSTVTAPLPEQPAPPPDEPEPRPAEAAVPEPPER